MTSSVFAGLGVLLLLTANLATATPARGGPDDRGLFGSIGQGVDNLFGGAADLAVGVVDTAASVVGGAAQAAGHLVGGAANLVFGAVGFSLDAAGNILDAAGNIIEGAVVDVFGHVLDAAGNVLDAAGNIIVGASVDVFGNVINAAGEILDAAGNVIKGTLDVFGNVIDEAGNILDAAGKIIVGARIDLFGNIIDGKGNILDGAGKIIKLGFGTALDISGNVLDVAGNIIKGAKLDLFGNILDAAGNVLDGAGKIIVGAKIDLFGNILDASGNVLDAAGNIKLGAKVDLFGNVLDAAGNIIRRAVGFTLNTAGKVLDASGKIRMDIKFDPFGNLIDLSGKVLDLAGNVIIGGSIDLFGNVLDASGHVLDAAGNIIIGGKIDLFGNVLDAAGKIIKRVGGFTLDAAGNVLDAAGRIKIGFKMDLFGNIIDGAGNVLDAAGNIILGAKIDLFGNIIDAAGNVLDAAGNIILGAKIDPFGNILDAAGNIIKGAVGFSLNTAGQVLDAAGRIIIGAKMDPFGNIINAAGDVLDKFGNIISGAKIDPFGNIIDGAGHVLDAAGNIIVGASIDVFGNVLDAAGNIIKGAVGFTLDAAGNVLDAAGRILKGVKMDAFGNLLDEAGNVLDKLGNIIIGAKIDGFGNIINGAGHVLDAAGNIIEGAVVDAAGNIKSAAGSLIKGAAGLIGGGLGLIGNLVTDVHNLFAATPDEKKGDVTIGGKRPGKSCVFPFSYNFQTYTGCTEVGGHEGQPWCATKVDWLGGYISDEWGYCAPSAKQDCVTVSGKKCVDGPYSCSSDIGSGGVHCYTQKKTLIIFGQTKFEECKDSCGTDCITRSTSTVPNRACVFPFKYGDVTYDTCTTTDNGAVPWCSVKVDIWGVHIPTNWGECGEGCPQQHSAFKEGGVWGIPGTCELTASTEYSDSYSVDAIFSQDTNSRDTKLSNHYWCSKKNVISNQWIQFAFPSPIAIDGFRIKSAKSYPDGIFDKFELQTSSDGDTWAPAFSGKGERLECCDWLEFGGQWGGAVAKFFRLNMNGNIKGPYLALGEFQFHYGSGDKIWSAPVAAIPLKTNSVWQNDYSKFSPDNILSEKGYWAAYSGKNSAWIKFSFPSEVAINGIRMKAADRKSYGKHMLKGWTLQTSSDGKNWMNQDGWSGTAAAENCCGWQEWSLGTTKASQFFRLTVKRRDTSTGWFGVDTGSYLTLGGLEFRFDLDFGKVAVPTAKPRPAEIALPAIPVAVGLKDAQTNDEIAGAQINWEVASAGLSGIVIADNLGVAIINIPQAVAPASLTITAVASGYQREELSVAVAVATSKPNEAPATQAVLMSCTKVLGAGEAVLKLNWLEMPSDLDLMVVKVSPFCRTYYAEKSGCGSLSLSLDCREGGAKSPETVTWSDNKGSKYLVYVNNYSNETSLAASGARIKYGTQVLEVPAGPADDNRINWFVGCIDKQGNFATKNNKLMKEAPSTDLCK
jgi:uncharacterized protein YfaP (DUF2135 family)